MRSSVSPEHVMHGVMREQSAENQVEEARRLTISGQSVTALPKLLLIIQQYPHTNAAINARYWLGITYYNIRSYNDAINALQDYIGLAPKGVYAKQANAYLQRINSEYNEKFPNPKKLDARIKELTDQLRVNSSDLAKQWELADLLWKRGDYNASARIYLYIVNHHPEYAKDATVTSRMERLPNGGYIALSPAEIERQEIKANPLVVINENSFRSNPDLLTRALTTYVVTGQVVNQGSSVLNGVTVAVTIYGFGGSVMGTRNVHIGRVNPGETRAFTASFNNFENIENINHYECVASFQH